MKHFLTQLPLIIATFSKALLVAIKEQILEVAGAFQKMIKSLWLVYCKIESSILETIVDVCFSILALRYFLALLSVGAFFLYFNWWWAFIIYAAVVFVAVIRFFSMPTSTTGPEIDEHVKNKERVVGFFRWPLRVLFSLIISIIYLSWYFNFFGYIDLIINKHAAQTYLGSKIYPVIFEVCSSTYPAEAERYNKALDGWLTSNSQAITTGEKVWLNFAKRDGTNMEVYFAKDIPSMKDELKDANKSELCSHSLEVVLSEQSPN